MDSHTLLRSHRPRKGMGQHFLVNEDILAAMARAADLRREDIVVEVGPGLGSLTKVLAEQSSKVLAVELDRDLAAKLQEILAAYPNVHTIQHDILELDLAAELARVAGTGDITPPYKVVANLPYYITTPTLRYFFERDKRPQVIVVTVQDEVAQRMTASPPRMNFLAVLVQLYGRAEIVRHIPPGAFYPPPKVHSAVVRIVMHAQPVIEGTQASHFLRLVSAGFSQPRKQVHNPLAQALGIPRDQVIAALRASGLDEKQRAETLSLADWLRLRQHLSPDRS